MLGLVYGSYSRADIQAYSTSNSMGNQDWGGNLGLDFNVNSAITVTQLGAFDSGQDGFVGAITVGLFERLPGTADPSSDHTGTLLASVAISGSEGTLSGNYRFLPLLSPLTLAPGFYDITAVGFSGSDPNLNENAGSVLINTNTGGGLISFVGSGRYDKNGTLDYPSETTDQQGYNTSSHVFGGGSFLFVAVPEPSSLAIAGLSGAILLVCFFFWSHRRRAVA